MKKTAIVRGASLFCLLIFIVVSCRGSALDKERQIDEFLLLCHEFRIFDGTVLVSESGKVIYKKSFAWLTENGMFRMNGIRNTSSDLSLSSLQPC